MNSFHVPFMYGSFPSECNDLKVSSSYFRDTALLLSSQCVSKSNWNGESEISPALELGSSGSSLEVRTNFAETAFACGSNCEELPPVGMCLDFSLNLEDKRECKEVRNSCPSVRSPKRETAKIDLELSLSTCVTESDVTSVALSSSPIQNGVENLASSDIAQLVDEGSTSSKWKRDYLQPFSDGQQLTDVVMPLQGPLTNVNPVSLAPNLPSVLIQPMNSLDAIGTCSKPPRRTSVKTCQFPGCGKGARGASGRCISHGGGCRCQRPGCQKGAEGKTAFCKAHGGGRRCEYLGCTKSAEGRTNLCIAHGGGKRCSFPEGCSRAARGKSELCIRHGGGKRCTIDNCTKSAEGLSGLCIAHGGGRRCLFPQCTKGAQGSTKFCKAHGGGKRCTFIGCPKGAEGSTPFCKGHGGGKRCSFQGGNICSKSVHGGTLFCVAHGGGKRCAIPGCTKSARGRTNFCVRHGGGRRCTFVDCQRSAQGSTNFCKAHGGGKRCLWGQPGSNFGNDSDSPCDKFARGKIGLCAAHKAQIHDKRVHGEASLGRNEVMTVNRPKCASNTVGDERTTIWNNLVHHSTSMQTILAIGACNGDGLAASASLPEGRVHGGSFMAMLMGGAVGAEGVVYGSHI